MRLLPKSMVRLRTPLHLHPLCAGGVNEMWTVFGIDQAEFAVV